MPSDDQGRQIALRSGLIVTVSECDYARVSRYRWRSRAEPHTTYVYGSSKAVRDRPLHRFILRLGRYDKATGLVVDHINGNGLDNRRENLRVCTQSQNVASKHTNIGTLSRFRGVSRCGTGWCMQAGNGGRRISRWFKLEVSAAIAYNQWAPHLHGEYHYLNPIPFVADTPRDL